MREKNGDALLWEAFWVLHFDSFGVCAEGWWIYSWGGGLYVCFVVFDYSLVGAYGIEYGKWNRIWLVVGVSVCVCACVGATVTGISRGYGRKRDRTSGDDVSSNVRLMLSTIIAMSRLFGVRNSNGMFFIFWELLFEYIQNFGQSTLKTIHIKGLFSNVVLVILFIFFENMSLFINIV